MKVSKKIIISIKQPAATKSSEKRALSKLSVGSKPKSV